MSAGLTTALARNNPQLASVIGNPETGALVGQALQGTLGNVMGNGSGPITPQIVQQFYQQYLGREAMPHEIQGHLNNPGGVMGLMETIRNSPEGLEYAKRPQMPQTIPEGADVKPSLPDNWAGKTMGPLAGPGGALGAPMAPGAAIAEGAKLAAGMFGKPAPMSTTGRFGTPAQAVSPQPTESTQMGSVGATSSNPWNRATGGGGAAATQNQSGYKRNW